MRSRYTAYVRGDGGHLLRTWHPTTRPTRVDHDPGLEWLGLEVLRTEAGDVGDAFGVVEFRAAYLADEPGGPTRGGSTSAEGWSTTACRRSPEPPRPRNIAVTRPVRDSGHG